MICDPLGNYKNFKEGRGTGPSGPNQSEDYSDYTENSEEIRPEPTRVPTMRPGIGPGGQFPGQRPRPGRRTSPNEYTNYNYPSYLSK